MEYNYTFKLDYDKANRLVAFTKTFSIDSRHEGIARCKRIGRTLTISSVNSFSMGSLKFAGEDFDEIPEGEEFYITVPKKKFTKKDVCVSINATQNHTTYATAQGSTSLWFDEVTSYTNVDRIIENQAETKFKIAFNPKLLAKALESFDTDYVELEFSGDISCAFIKDEREEELAVVAPKRLKK